MNRRKFIYSLGALTALAVMPQSVKALQMFGSKKKNFPFHLTDAQWKERLTPEQYNILREAGTERSYSSPLSSETRGGQYYCVGCGHLLFQSQAKFISKSGWPSFYEPVDEHAIGTMTDYKIGIPRKEVHCGNCGGHLGHVFKDGPPPTGLRYCINGTVLSFTPNE